MHVLKHLLIAFALLGFTACDGTDYTSVWTDPAIRNVDWNGAASVFLLSGNESARRSFEDHLAGELAARGIEASPGYKVLPNDDPTQKETLLSNLKNTKQDYAVFMRVVDEEQQVNYIPGSSWYGDPYYDQFYWYGGHYYGPAGFGYGWPPYYDPGYFTVDTIVSVETQLYAVPDSKLLFAGMSRTMNPSELDDFVEELADETFDELRDIGAISGD
jgi:hypothetical protein